MLFQLFKKTPSISTKELQSRLSKEITLLDVRTPSEYRAGHIPQAINVPLNKIPAYNKSANEVYVICQSGMRSKKCGQNFSEKKLSRD